MGWQKLLELTGYFIRGLRGLPWSRSARGPWSQTSESDSFHRSVARASLADSAPGVSRGCIFTWSLGENPRVVGRILILEALERRPSAPEGHLLFLPVWPPDHMAACLFEATEWHLSHFSCL